VRVQCGAGAVHVQVQVQVQYRCGAGESVQSLGRKEQRGVEKMSIEDR
jgi:hypothetical protein